MSDAAQRCGGRPPTRLSPKHNHACQPSAKTFWATDTRTPHRQCPLAQPKEPAAMQLWRTASASFKHQQWPPGRCEQRYGLGQSSPPIYASYSPLPATISYDAFLHVSPCLPSTTATGPTPMPQRPCHNTPPIPPVPQSHLHCVSDLLHHTVRRVITQACIILDQHVAVVHLALRLAGHINLQDDNMRQATRNTATATHSEPTVNQRVTGYCGCCVTTAETLTGCCQYTLDRPCHNHMVAFGGCSPPADPRSVPVQLV
jgi:hypothetical protein